MIGMSRLVGAFVLTIFLFGARAEAQDSSLMDMNMDMGCMMMAGMHEMRLAAYSHASDSREDVCSDIPAPGPVTLTLNAVSKELRDMMIEVRVIRSTGTASPPTGAALEAATLAYLPPKTYRTGVVTLPVNFDKAGKYSVLLNVDDGAGMAMASQYDLTVEQGAKQWYYVLAFAIAAVAAAGGFYVWDERRKKLKAPAKNG
ncbi:hypothetical protein [Methylocapsa acidiphila]|uniref:hypothetical protein n=1 Tax=Methylocapsa acidiphila TaxID=133552 RepID=UPI00040C1EE6|nr:hypothetical protein [Methylocapsa acidiphila]